VSVCWALECSLCTRTLLFSGDKSTWADSTAAATAARLECQRAPPTQSARVVFCVPFIGHKSLPEATSERLSTSDKPQQKRPKSGSISCSPAFNSRNNDQVLFSGCIGPIVWAQFYVYFYFFLLFSSLAFMFISIFIARTEAKLLLTSLIGQFFL